MFKADTPTIGRHEAPASRVPCGLSYLNPTRTPRFSAHHEFLANFVVLL